MLRTLTFGAMLIALIVIYGVSYGQSRNVAPYVGASGSFIPIYFGWDLEAGLRFSSFYGGIEYGAYYAIPAVRTDDPLPGSVPPASSVRYVGIQAGVLDDSSTLIGIVVLQSHKVWNSFDSTNTFWDFGIDLKHSLAESHIYLALALTYRRGIKAGIGYMF